MNKILRKFISYFIISGLVYFLFLIVETISLYFSEFGFDLKNGVMVSFSQIQAVINFGALIAFILTTADLLKQKTSVSKIFKFGLIISLIFGGLIFLLSNKVVPELRLSSFLYRYENARQEAFTSQERAEKTMLFKKTNVNMMSIGQINQYLDSLKTEDKSQRKLIADLFQKIPDSIIQSDFSKKELEEYGIMKNNLTTEFNRRDFFNLKSEIGKNTVLTTQLKKTDWAKNVRYINSFLTFIFVCLGVVIGANFKSQLKISLVCIGIVIYSQTLNLLITASDYFISGENLIGLIFKIMIILIVFLYLVYRIKMNKNADAYNL